MRGNKSFRGYVRTSLFTATVMLCAFLALSVSASAWVTPNTQLRYTQIGQAARIDGCNGACPANLIIPSQISVRKGKVLKVTSIARDAFNMVAMQTTHLKNVSIPPTVTQIGAGAFLDNDLETVVLPSSITSIASDTFANNNLAQVTIPAKVSRIGYGAFAGNWNLAWVRFLGKAPLVEERAFSGVREGKALRNKTLKGFGANGSLWNGLIVAER